MKCIYHNADLDGKCSAAIVKYRFPECELIGMDYDDIPKWDKIYDKFKVGEIVFMVDFSLPMEKMIKINQYNDFHWIDHHITALKSYQKYRIDCQYEGDTLIKGKLNETKAACELTWEYLFPNKPMPEVVRLLGRYDVWDLSDSRVLQFQFGMRTWNTDPEVFDWKLAFEYWDIDETIRDGIHILEYRSQENKKYLSTCAFETVFEGHPALAMNRGFTNSQAFDDGMDVSKYDLCISFYYNKNRRWTVSLYSQKIDVGELAKQYGGGGHKGAAGFITDDISIIIGR